MEIWDGPEVGGRTFVPLKHQGWCDYHGVVHAYAELPRVSTDDPRRRWCVNCGHTQRLEPPPTVVILKWVDE